MLCWNDLVALSTRVGACLHNDLVHMFSNPAVCALLWWRSTGGSCQDTVLELRKSGTAIYFIFWYFPNNLLALTMGFGHHWAVILFLWNLFFTKQLTLKYAKQHIHTTPCTTTPKKNNNNKTKPKTNKQTKPQKTKPTQNHYKLLI